MSPEKEASGAARGQSDGRLKTRAQMAGDLGISVSAFDAWVKDGTLPPPLHGKRRWDSKAVHAALDRASGIKEQSGLSDYDRWKATSDADAA